jgi:hypothetical protein
LGLRNWGRKDAENVIITASFTDPLTSISTDQLAIPFEPSAGGIGQKFVAGTIKRIVPEETVNVYFFTEPSSRWADYKPTIRDIKFNHGHGETGIPFLRIWVPAFLWAVLFWAAISVPLYFLAKRLQHPFVNRFREAIQMGISTRQEGLSEEQLLVRLEEWYKTLPFLNRPRRQTLIACAQAAFEGVKQTPA